MAESQDIQWETGAVPPKQSAFKSLLSKQHTFSNLFHGDGTKPTKSIWEKNPFTSLTATKDTPAGNEETAKNGRRHQKRNRIIIGVAVLLLLVLIIGLAVGLTRKGSKSEAKNLPLPSNTATFTGDITFYSPDPGYGACGFQNTSTQAICAVSYIIFQAAMVDGNSNHNPLCGKKIRITRPNGGRTRSVDVTVVDRCEACAAEDLDLSMKMFTTLADEELGRTKASWAWLN